MTDEIIQPSEVEFNEAFSEASDPVDSSPATQDTSQVEQQEDSFLSDEPNEQSVQEPEPEQPREEHQPEPEQPADPLAALGLTEAQREYVLKVKRERDEVAHKYESDRGRFLAAQRVLQQVNQERKQESERKPTKEQVASAIQDPAKHKAFIEDYPEIAEFITARETQLRNEVKQEVFDQVRPTLETLRQKAIESDQERQQAAIQREFKRLEAAHEDWADVARSSEFREWAVKQPQAVQQVIAKSYQADEISAVMTYYKAGRQPVASPPPRTINPFKTQCA